MLFGIALKLIVHNLFWIVWKKKKEAVSLLYFLLLPLYCTLNFVFALYLWTAFATDDLISTSVYSVNPVNGSPWMIERLVTDADKEAMSVVLSRYFPLLKRVYQHYGYSGKGHSTMDNQEFWSLLKDIKLASRSCLTVHQLYKFFYEEKGLAVRDMLAQNYTLEASEFVVALAKVAYLAFGEGRLPIPSGGLHVEQENEVVSKFTLLVEGYIKPNA